MCPAGGHGSDKQETAGLCTLFDMIQQGLGCVVLHVCLQAGAAWPVGCLAEKALKSSLLGGKRACVKHARARMMGQVGFQTINKMPIHHVFLAFVFIGAGWLKADAVGGTRFNPWCCCGRLRVFSVSGAAVAVFPEGIVFLFICIRMIAMLTAGSLHCLRTENIHELLAQIT